MTCANTALPLILVLIVVTSATPCSGQSLAWSHGTQTLRMGIDECVSRAESALSTEDYRVDDRSEGWRGGSKGTIRAEIACSPAPGSATTVNISVVTTAIAGNVPESEKTRLQQRMEPFRDRGGAGASPELTGRWNWVATCRNSTPSGRWEITMQRGNVFSGAFSNANSSDTGSIDGQQQGLLVEFRRQIPGVGQQQWTGGVERNGNNLRMEGKIGGNGGPCTFSASSVNNGRPRPAGSQTNVAGRWNWTATCGAAPSSGEFQILNQRRDGTLSGAFSNANASDTGTIDGEEQGLLLEFKRQMPGAGEQHWTGGLALNNGVLAMEGRIDGTGGPCTFTATMGP